MNRLLPLCALPLLSLACAHAVSNEVPYAADSIVQAPDRSDADRAKDAGRHPAELLRFLHVEPGMRVGDVMAGDGYTTELLARAVGPTGKVYSENPKWIRDRAEKPWSDRLATPANKNVQRSDDELEQPFPTDLAQLDLVVDFANYHDTVWQKTDRTKMNASIFQVLKNGGRYAVCDSSAKPGSGLETAEQLHRIDEQVVRSEVLAAGFQWEADGDFLRNPSDTRDWNASPRAAGARRGTSDRFCLMFRKPAPQALR